MGGLTCADIFGVWGNTWMDGLGLPQAKNIARTAAVRHLLSCVFYAMRDGHVRFLAARAAERNAA